MSGKEGEQPGTGGPRPGATDPATPEAVTEEEPTSPRSAEERAEREHSLSDFVRRAVSAGVGAAAKSKDDIMRAAAGEMRNWLEHLNLNDELAKVLTKLVVEVKTEIRFRPTEDGKIVPETSNDFKLKGPGTGGGP
ncbi:MAG TPA: hypothetical protein VHK47_04780 [Polyangia bacterium]|jgi:hypothetical protein|nr:hypothetical protein [Polyangia bacterium]